MVTIHEIFCLIPLGLITERKRFGHYGWAAEYDFDDNDFSYTKSIITKLCSNRDDFSWAEVVSYIMDISYGSRIFDEWDRRVLATYCRSIFHEELEQPEKLFYSEEKLYYIPSDMSQKGVLDYIASLPNYDRTELFDLHPNASIHADIQKGELLLEHLSKIKRVPTSVSVETDYSVIVEFVLEQIPQTISLMAIEPMETVNFALVNEIRHYNRLLDLALSQLTYALGTLKGLLPTTVESTSLCMNLSKEIVPAVWLAALPSNQPLGAWILNLQKRITYLKHGSSGYVHGKHILFYEDINVNHNYGIVCAFRCG